MEILILVCAVLVLAAVVLTCVALKERKKQKEGYSEGSYRTIGDWSNTPPLTYANGWKIESSPGDQYCSSCEPRKATGCSCNRLTADMTDPYRTRYPIDLPSPFAAYELPGPPCPKCLEVMKYDMQ